MSVKNNDIGSGAFHVKTGLNFRLF